MKDLITILITLSLTLCQVFILLVAWIIAMFRASAYATYFDVRDYLGNYIFSRIIVVILSSLFCGVLMGIAYLLARKLIIRFEIPMLDIRTRTFLKWQILSLFCFSIACEIYSYYYYTQMPSPK